jgi:photosystem II stability/assembly factor-like uncharacterized protein
MRPSLLALLTTALLAQGARAAGAAAFEDAPLHAVHFLDAYEGWAVGDEGVVWHTIDGGKHWDRQASGVRASLRSVCFIDKHTGWIAGREELPLGAGSSGVLLYTRDAGETWRAVSLNTMPGLSQVSFVDEKTGHVVGDGTDQFPSGAFVTRDGGRTWQPVPGPRCPGWKAAAFTGPDGGILVGAWNRLAILRKAGISPSNVDTLGGRNVRGIYLPGKEKRGVAVGQGGLLLLTDNAGANWDLAELLLPPAARNAWDFHAVHGAEGHLWVAGRPGSVLLHSSDGGKTWEMQRTGQALPLNGLFFLDGQHGWAVGELGTILVTGDGGRTWTTQRQGGKRAALLLMNARSTGVPADLLARLGGDEGYLATAVQVVASDHATAAPARAGEGDRLEAAVRQAGGAAGELLWQFPLPDLLTIGQREGIEKRWITLHGERAVDHLLGQLVLAIRVWRPDVLVTDPSDGKGKGSPLDALLAEVVKEAFVRAADPKAFPEQISSLGLQPWKPAKLYAVNTAAGKGTVTYDLLDVRAHLKGTVRDFATPSASLLAGSAVVLPRRRPFSLVASTVPGAEGHHDLMQGVKAVAGDARRQPSLPGEVTAEALKALRARATLQALTENSIKGLSDPERMLAALGPMLETMPDGQGAPALHAVATGLARQGQWFLARESFLQMVQRYPAHPLSASAFRWLIRHNSSSETRRRHELGHFIVHRELTFMPVGSLPPGTTAPPPLTPGVEKEKGDRKKTARQMVQEMVSRLEVQAASGTAVTTFRRAAETIRWHQGSLELEPKLAGFGALLTEDPSIQFCLHAARRNLGDFETPRKWFNQFIARQPAGPWRDAAASELWLADRRGLPPKPVLTCRYTETRPFLDGQFDDPCWKDLDPVPLKDANEQPGTKPAAKNPAAKGDPAPTKVWMAYDQQFLYLALRCEHPAERYVPPVKGRKRDANLDNYDRVSLFLDLDRDYATCFHFEVDQRGCVREECWGDWSWNPHWFVAVHSEQTFWQIEAAIPLVALTGDTITSGRAWACNVVRVQPGQGVQAWSLPAGLPEKDPRLEGMGLLMFHMPPRPGSQQATRPHMPSVR